MGDTADDNTEHLQRLLENRVPFNHEHVRQVFLEHGLIPTTFVESTDIKFANFRLTKHRTLLLIPKGPGYRKWVSVATVQRAELEYHIRKALKELT